MSTMSDRQYEALVAELKRHALHPPSGTCSCGEQVFSPGYRHIARYDDDPHDVLMRHVARHIRMAVDVAAIPPVNRS